MRSDPEIERLEADLHRSRFEKWDVETFLVERHQAKIDALTKPKGGKLRSAWLVFREITDPFAIFVGWAFAYLVFVLWLLDWGPFR